VFLNEFNDLKSLIRNKNKVEEVLLEPFYSTGYEMMKSAQQHYYSRKSNKKYTNIGIFYKFNNSMISSLL